MNKTNRISEFYSNRDLPPGLKRVGYSVFALVSVAIICAATRPDIANIFIGLMTGK